MEIAAPETIHHLLREFIRSFQGVLGERLVGVYLHGSLAMGCFNPISSDVDILVVVREDLGTSEKSDLGQILLQLSTLSPSNGLEMSILTLQSLTNFQHPCLYELHFSDGNKADYVSGCIDFLGPKLDPDLAAHIVITRARGICLYGEPINTVFPLVPDEYYMDSIVKDSDWSYANIMRGPDSGEGRVPAYGVLNFCRVLAFVEQGLITSKLEGGQWGIEQLPGEYKPIIQEALTEYKTSGSAKNVDLILLKQFAHYAKTIINYKAMKPSSHQ
jgi:hypothetical protein